MIKTSDLISRRSSCKLLPCWLGLWGMRSISSLPSFPGPLCPRVVTPDRVLSMGQIELVNKRNIVLLFDNTTFDKTTFSKNHVGKNVVFRFVCSSLSPYSTDLAPNDFYLVRSLQNVLRNKNFLMRISWKCLLKTSSAGKQLNFTWEESKSYLVNGKM